MTGRGFAAVPSWIVEDESISGHAKLILLILMAHHSEGGEVFPAHPRIAKLSALSVSTVQRALRELRDIGIVDWEQGDSRHGGRASNTYEIRTTRRRKKPPTPGQGDRGPRSERPGPPVRVTDELEPANQNQRTLSADASRSQSLPGLEAEPAIRETSAMRNARPDVQRLVREGTALFLAIDERARADANAARTARLLLDERHTDDVDAVLAVLRFALADSFWSGVITSWTKFRAKYVDLRVKASTSGPAAPPERPTAAVRAPGLEHYFGGSQGLLERRSLFVSRSVDPERWNDPGRDQEALLRRVLALPIVYPIGEREHHELCIAEGYRYEGQTMTGAVPTWRAIPV